VPVDRFGLPLYGRADGGYISGPGTATSDSIPAMLSDGEYVVKASAVRSLGVEALDSINETGRLLGLSEGVELPGFRDGGMVGMSSLAGGATKKPLAGGGYIEISIDHRYMRVVDSPLIGTTDWEPNQTINLPSRPGAAPITGPVGASIPGSRKRPLTGGGYFETSPDGEYFRVVDSPRIGSTKWEKNGRYSIDFAAGGMISGPGTGTSDSIPAMLSDGEYVIKASSVRSLGVDYLDKLNKGYVPGFAMGGLVGDTPAPAFSAGGGVNVDYTVVEAQSKPKPDDIVRTLNSARFLGKFEGAV
jgi:hypothetical protein